MEGGAKIKGLDEAMRALQAAFPDDPKAQTRLVNQAMGPSARGSFLPIAKQLAERKDSSGALAESLGVRAMSARKRRARGAAGGMEIVPVRGNKKAMAKYIDFYYTRRGKNPDGKAFIDGIRHGHLVEFGTALMPAAPFLWPAAVAGERDYRNAFAAALKLKIEAAVRRKAKKRAAKR